MPLFDWKTYFLDSLHAFLYATRRLEPYEYRPLETEDTIRLLMIEPGFSKNPVICRVIHVDLKTSPDYEALSYLWANLDGDTTLSRHVILADSSVTWPFFAMKQSRRLFTHAEDENDAQVHRHRLAPLAITDNCDMALRRLRLKSKTRTVWIDAICINQQDDQEKSMQVQRMRQIYASAGRVFAYLGEHGENSKFLFEKLNSSRWDRELPLRGSAYSACVKLFSRPWFERVWVLQEITFPGKVQLLCGDSKLPMDRVTGESFNIKDLPLTQPEKPRYGFRPPVLDFHRMPQDKPDPLEIIRLARHCRSKDPRDKVFALCGLANGALLD